MTQETTLLTAEEVADELRVHPETVRRWARDGEIPSIRLPGGGFRFRRSDIDELLTQGATL